MILPLIVIIPSTNRMEYIEDCDLSDDWASDMDDGIHGDINLGTGCYTVTDETDLERFNEARADVDSDLEIESDTSSVTEDGYLAGEEETQTILWRHIAFYIIRSEVPGGPNVLSAVVTLLHTKGEYRKPRM